MSPSKDGWHAIAHEVVLRAVPNNWLRVRGINGRPDIQSAFSGIDVPEPSVRKTHLINKPGFLIDASVHGYTGTRFQGRHQVLLSSRTHFLVPNRSVTRKTYVRSLCKYCEDEKSATRNRHRNQRRPTHPFDHVGPRWVAIRLDLTTMDNENGVTSPPSDRGWSSCRQRSVGRRRSSRKARA